MKRKRLLLILLAAVVVIGALCALLLPKGQSGMLGKNIISNGDFESYGTDGLPEAWYTDAYQTGEEVTSFDMAPGRSGMAVHIKSLMQNDARFGQRVSVDPDSLYCLEGYIKAKASYGRGANLSIEGVYLFTDVLFDTEGEWEKVTLYGRTGEDQTSLNVFARLGGYSGESVGEAWFDDVTLTKVDSVPAGVAAYDFYKTGASDDTETDRKTSFGMMPLLLVLLLLYAMLAFAMIYPRGKSGRNLSRNRLILLTVIFAVLALCLRLFFMLKVPGYDVDIGCFTSWANTAAQVGPLDFYAASGFCDYPPGYILVLWLIGLIGKLLGTGTTEFMVKIVPVLSDLLGGLALLLFSVRHIERASGRERARMVGLALMALYLLNPLPILTGAGWGQSDSVMTLFLLLTVLFALEGRWRFALPMYMLSVLMKPQALMFGPLGLLALAVCFIKARKEKDALLALTKDALIGLGALVIVFFAVAVPFSIRQGGFTWLFDLYANTMNSYGYASVNACNPYFIFGFNWASASETAPWYLAIAMGLTLTIPALLIYMKRSVARNTRLLALIVALMGPVLALIGAFVPMRFSTLGGLLIGASIVIVFAAYLINGDIKHLPFLGAVLLILLFNTGTMMHERYLFPALALLLVAYLLEKDMRILLLMLLLTVSLTLNVGCVLDRNQRIGGSAGHLSAPGYGIKSDVAVLEYLSAALNWLASGFALYLSLSLTDESAPRYMPKPKEEAADAPRRIGEYALYEARENRLADRRMHRADWIVMLSVTVVYAFVAFLHLGSMTAPQTDYRFTDENEQVVFDLGENREAFRMLYYGGIHYNDSDFTVETSLDGVTYNTAYTCQMLEGSCFQWKYVQGYSIGDMRDLSGRYVRLTADHIGLTLFEVLFRDLEGSVLPVARVEDSLGADVSALIDEPGTLSGEPGWYNSMYFDEIYHARTAYELLHGLSVYEWTHPQLGKDVMALCVAIFGMTPFGWRFAGTLCGVLMLPGMYLLGKLLFKKRRYAVLSMALMALDCMHYTQTRIATIDSFVVLFIIWAVYFMLRWFYQDFFGQKLWRTLVPLALSGLFMGLAVASKWTGCYAGVGLAAVFFYGIGRRFAAVREAKRLTLDQADSADGYARAAAQKGMIRLLLTVASCLIFFIAVPLVIYYCAYIPHFAPEGGVTIQKIINLSVGTYFQNGYMGGMLGYHSTPGLGMDHQFYTPWYEWPLSVRPMYYAADQYEPAGYAATILSFGNLSVWWVGALCMVIALYAYLRHQAWPAMAGGYRADKRYLFAPKGERDERPALLLICFAAQYLPWMLVPRGTYLYHYFPSIPFIILSICLIAEYVSDFFVRGAERKERNVQRADRVMLGMLIGYIVIVGLMFIAFFPYASGWTVRTEWLDWMNWLGEALPRGWLFY